MSLPFVRDRRTLVLYSCLLAFGLAIPALGPAVPGLRADLGISRAVVGLHFTAGAMGSVLVGLVGSRLVARVGRRRMLLAGLLGLGVGPLGLVLGPSAAWTITGAFVYGMGGNFVLLVVNAALSDHHGAHRPTALAEASTITSIVFIMPGLLIAGLEAAGSSWRLAFLAPALAALAVLRPVMREDLPKAPPPAVGEGSLLPGFVAAVVALALSIAIEWSIAGWSAGHLVDAVGADVAVAALGPGLFYGAVTVGRLTAVPLTRRLPEDPLLWWSLGLTVLGFPLFWLGPSTGWVMAGVVVCGLGIANQFPLLASVMFARAPGLTDAASSRIALVGGLAVMIAPLTLGAWADARGLFEALSGVALLIVVFAGAMRMLRRPRAIAGSLST